MITVSRASCRSILARKFQQQVAEPASIVRAPWPAMGVAEALQVPGNEAGWTGKGQRPTAEATFGNPLSRHDYDVLVAGISEDRCHHGIDIGRPAFENLGKMFARKNQGTGNLKPAVSFERCRDDLIDRLYVACCDPAFADVGGGQQHEYPDEILLWTASAKFHL